MKQHITRAYNSFQIDSARGVLSKKSKEERLSNEINYYKNLDSNSSIYFPRLLDSRLDGQDYIMDFLLALSEKRECIQIIMLGFFMISLRMKDMV